MSTISAWIAENATKLDTAEMQLDEAAPAGFTVSDVRLPPPEAGSIEAALSAAGLADSTSLLDLRTAPNPGEGEGIDRIRSQSAYMHTPVMEAFDAVLCVPSVTLEQNLGL